MKKVEPIFKQFKSEKGIFDYFDKLSKKGKAVHCVSCKNTLRGDEEYDFTLQNSLGIAIETDEGEVITCVPRIVCQKCGYKNTVLKLLYQTV